VKQGDGNGSRKTVDFEVGDIPGASDFFMETETVVDDPDDRCADSVWPSSHIYAEFGRGSFYLHPVLGE
jgi:hypothetical protein